MGDIGLLKQGWNWLQCQKQGFMAIQISVRFFRDRLVCWIDHNWPMVYSCCLKLGGFLLILLFKWRDCIVRGFSSLIGLSSTALFVILWSCSLSLTSTSCLVYAILILGASGATIHYLGYTSGLFIVGIFGILTMWIYGNFWISGVLFMIGGYMFSLNHARLLIFMSTTYSIYFVYVRTGWIGGFVSINLAFFSNDLLNNFLQVYDHDSEGAQSEGSKESEPVTTGFSEDTDFSTPTGEAENLASHKSSNTPNFVNVQKCSSPSKVVKTESSSLDEIERIMNSANHYEALDFPRDKIIDPDFLKREYRRKAMLVHPDKNMGNPLASESFKKLQCAYEVLSDFTKKRNYDEQLRKEESRSVNQKSHGSSQQDGVEYRSEESRRIECTKCGNSHIWICTNRSKARARWCQDCCQHHQAKDGDGWLEYGGSSGISSTKKVEIPRAFVCAESKIFDASEWATCQLQGVVCRPNTHCPSFHVNMVGLDKTTQRSNPSRYPWGLDVEMMSEDEDDFEVWFQQALASGLFSETTQRRKSWSPFKISHNKGLKAWRRFS